jgi:flagellar hook-associated protein 2
VDVHASDSLSTIATKINSLKGGFSATVMNDGGTTNPFTLAITSATSGRRGELLVDSGNLDLGLTTLTKPQDAIVTVGQSGAGTSMLVTSSTNTLTGVVPGVTINLLSESDKEVTVTTAQDVESMVTAMQSFVDAYNAVQEAIDAGTEFNADTQTRGPLLGDSTISLIRSRMHSTMSRSFQDADPRVSRLFAIGLKLGSNNQLEFDAEKFRETYEATPEIVEELFTEAETGLGARLEENLDALTRSFDGVLARKDELLGDQQEVLADRIESLNILLEAKRKRLEAQFAGLESSLAALQGQQNSLTELALLAGR